jgi:hypothetical protein
VRRSLLCFAILLGLPCAVHAHAQQTGAVALPEKKPAIAPEAFADGEPLLDLSFDPAVAAVEDLAPFVPQAASASPAPRVEERGFSLGLDIKPRRDMRSPASRATAEEAGPPTLADKVEGLVERSSIGVTGTYRF